jgi:hypothetical protein
MKILVPLVLLFLSFAFYLALDQDANLGRKPESEEVIFTKEVNKVTGELMNVEIVRCRLCGQVLSYIQYNLKGKVLYGYVYSHRCGKYGTSPVARYNGSGFGPLHWNLFAWLEKWQKRLQFK